MILLPYAEPVGTVQKLLLALAVVLVGVDGATLGLHDFNGASATAHSVATTVPGAVTTTTTIPGTTFRGPRGNYSLQVDPTWPHHSNTPIEGIETWVVQTPANGFAPNMNAIVENLPRQFSVDEYLQANVASLPKLFSGGATIVGSHLTTGSFGQRLGVLEYTASVAGHTLHFEAICSVKDLHAVVVTFTTNEAGFAALRAQLDPYVLTLQAI